ncbi:MAG: hypothetical protein A3E88_02460 [Legionellales bacterium RIFCSPHIGHO2_12_FULL_35_11]|nr:MAG: hypothetical protein A3E88_02460 [Legionellales bacterium RIFCSPHIGHO2_12_FULL_35_11]
MSTNFSAILLSLCIASTPAIGAISSNPTQNSETNITKNINKINLNKADAATLTNSFKGIGAGRAKNIIIYRQTKGQFKSINDLAMVKGFSKNFVEKNIIGLKKIFTIE